MQSQGNVTIERMCTASGVSRAGFYRHWEEKEPDEVQMHLRDAVQRESLKHPSYGAPKLTRMLRQQGFTVSVSRVSRIRREDNLLAIRRRKFVRTTDSEHDFLVYPNLAEHLQLTAINQLWVADITYLRLGAEFVYMAVVLDAFSRRVLGWAVERSLHTALPLAALERAIATRPPMAGLVHHSDRGSQYASHDYVDRLEKYGILSSMSRPGRPWENARCERFMRTMKEEEIQVRQYRSLEQLQANIEDFIENFYNRTRMHAALDFLSPEEFEKQAANPPVTAAVPPVAGLSFRRHREIYPDIRF
jgi:putative transposase